jgi:hypothetical protein
VAEVYNAIMAIAWVMISQITDQLAIPAGAPVLPQLGDTRSEAVHSAAPG